jgi:mannose-6-phosphate isomerase-like protein (cupin superfamily)
MSLHYDSDRFHLVTHDQAIHRQVSDSKKIKNYITDEFSPNVSLSVIEADDFESHERTEYDRIYFVLEGRMIVAIDGQEYVLRADDSLFLHSGTEYIMKGSFRSIVVNQPAFGTR